MDRKPSSLMLLQCILQSSALACEKQSNITHFWDKCVLYGNNKEEFLNVCFVQNIFLLHFEKNLVQMLMKLVSCDRSDVDFPTSFISETKLVAFVSADVFFSGGFLPVIIPATLANPDVTPSPILVVKSSALLEFIWYENSKYKRNLWTTSLLQRNIGTEFSKLWCSRGVFHCFR